MIFCKINISRLSTTSNISVWRERYQNQPLYIAIARAFINLRRFLVLSFAASCFSEKHRRRDVHRYMYRVCFQLLNVDVYLVRSIIGFLQAPMAAEWKAFYSLLPFMPSFSRCVSKLQHKAPFLRLHVSCDNKRSLKFRLQSLTEFIIPYVIFI